MKKKSTVYWKCTKCGKGGHGTEQHVCLPGMMGLGTQEMHRFRDTSIGKQIDGNVELAWHRGFSAGLEEAVQRLIHKKLKKAAEILEKTL